MKGLLVLDPADVITSLAASDLQGVLSEFAARLAERQPGVLADDLLRLLLEREALGSTGIGDGIAIPHCKHPAFKVPVLLFGRSERGVDFRAVDGRPVRLFFLLVAPEEAAGVHLKLLARISRMLKEPAFRTRLLEAVTAEEIASVVSEQGSRP